MMQLYEDLGFPIDETLVKQYLHRDETAQDFALFYDIWQKYRQDWQVDDILQGHLAPSLREKAAGATFDEKLALTLQLTSRCEELSRDALETYDALKQGLPLLKKATEATTRPRRFFTAAGFVPAAASCSRRGTSLQTPDPAKNCGSSCPKLPV